VWPAHHSRRRPYEDQSTLSDFARAVYAAVDRANTTVALAARAAGLHPPTVSAWLYGKHVPFREDIIALALVLQAPGLIPLARAPWRQLTLVCRACRSRRRVRPSIVEGRLRHAGGSRRSRYDGATINDVTGEVDYLCKDCASTGLLSAEQARQRFWAAMERAGAPKVERPTN
jgi:hypothetical protein